MKVPWYIINNSIFLIINIIFCLWFMTKQRKVKSIPLYDFQVLLNIFIFINEVFFAFALYYWFKSGMDNISWKVDSIQQKFYIIAENSKSVFRFLILLIMHFPRRYK